MAVVTQRTKGEQTGETDRWSDRKCEPKIVWTKSARGGGDKRLAGETKDGWLDENQFAILALEVRAEWYFGGEENGSEGTSNCAQLSAEASSWETLISHICSARESAAWHGVAASNILSWRMIASLTLIYRPSKVSLPLDSPHEGPIG